MWHIDCRKINADNIVFTKVLIYKHQLWNKRFTCVSNNTTYDFVELRNINLFCSILVPQTDFDKSQPTFWAVHGKVGLTLLEEVWGNQGRYIVLHIWEHQVSCYIIVAWGLFYYHGLTWIPSWISNHMLGKVWDEITYPFLNFNGATVEV